LKWEQCNPKSFYLIICFSWTVPCKQLRALFENIEGLLLKGIGCGNMKQHAKTQSSKMAISGNITLTSQSVKQGNKQQT
jgi:hypothetical protein